MFENVYKNKYGFYELKTKPSKQEMSAYYSNIYYQEAKGSYEKSYSDIELEFINNKLEQKYIIVEELIGTKKRKELKFLDVGCGEGWSLNFFQKKGWEVTGIDFSSYGCEKFNTQVSEYFIVGDIYTNLEKLIEKKIKFDCIYLVNVLEHVLKPLMLLKRCYELLNNDGIIVIQVPNDFSQLQQYLMDNKIIDKEFWICIPDHISYFNIQGLLNLCNDAGLKSKKIMSDFPIDFNLFNSNTNYVMDRSKGKSCHYSRIEIENFLHNISPNKVNNLYEAIADLGLGRNIICFLMKC